MVIGKSTVHKDLAERLPGINPSIAARVREILDINKADRHIRVGKPQNCVIHGMGLKLIVEHA